VSNKALVSIITPAYNSERYLQATIDSVLAQEYTNWEYLIVVDKNSSDDTLKIAKAATSDPRISCITSPLSGGTANNRQIGLNLAQGEFVAFLDADDLWHSSKLQKQISFMQNKNIDFSYTSYQWMDEKGNSLPRQLIAPKTVSYKELLEHRHSLGCLTVLIRREKFKGIPYENIGAEDFTYWLKLLKTIPYASGLQENLAQYRIVPNSRSRNKLVYSTYRWASLRQGEKISIAPALYYFALYAFHSIRRLL
jgi:teichuronic acid biosynthesis glycosyltransferase TuaG